MPLSFLRPDLPRAYSFSVTEKPHRAKLDQNEAPADLPAELKRELAEELAAQPWNLYLQPRTYLEAKSALAEVIGVAPERVALTSGGDQAIEAAYILAGGPGRRARWFEPTYPYIAHAARRTGTEPDPIQLGSEVDRLIDADRIDAEPRPDLIALVAPNNPTGGLPAREAVQAALADEHRLLFIDEAYADFSGASHLDLLSDHPNLLVGRSLSKSMLAGVHAGYVCGHPEAIAMIERMYTAPYHLNAVQLLVARRYRDIRPHVEEAAALVVRERARVTGALAALSGIAPRESRANFVLFEVERGPDASAALHRRLADAGVRVRNVAGLPGLESFLRVTIGTPEQNDLFLESL